jgi:histidine kinase
VWRSRAPAIGLASRFMNSRFRFLHFLLFVLLLAAAIVVSSLFTARLAVHHALQQQIVQGNLQLQLRALALQRLIERFRILPRAMAIDPEFRAALAGELHADELQRLHQKLKQAATFTHAPALIIVNSQGAVLADSDEQPSAPLNFRFRPWFTQAMQEGSGAFYCVSVNSPTAGYAIAEAIRGDHGQFLGAVAMKIHLAEQDREWLDGVDTVLLSDAYGIVFLANRSAWNYRRLYALDATALADLKKTRQYGDFALHATSMRLLEKVGTSALRFKIEEPFMPGDYLWLSREVGEQHWEMHILLNTRTSMTAGRFTAATTALCWLPLILLGMYFQQRMRMARDRKQSRAELENMVSHYTAALRSAQDEVVEAANKASPGQTASLEHLPQGVCVVDARLRLTAWNARYASIFHYPTELLQVGRPIADLYRFNARRGLLGTGDTEGAIQHRLDYLSHGGSYVHERAWPDGTVLEVRGNPLPDGGFVTSFADITSYKAAARDLRALATTLEQRVDERTRDLDAAKAEAEYANRSKTRFVTAAVHDLLQPLNAARMYAGSLRRNLSEPDQQELMVRVEKALAAEDELLGSLLDIAQLEAGVMPCHVQNVPLAPLLEALQTDFGMLARARGLELHYVPSSVSLRTDPALLRRILQNFLSNAIHYTSRGRVLLGCRRRGAMLRIEIWDTGPGIPESRQRDIFEEFTRLDDGRKVDDRGAGLGLSIVERIGRMLSHPIGLRSWPGKGSVFSVEAPIARVAGNNEIAVDVQESDEMNTSPLHDAHVWCIGQPSAEQTAAHDLMQSWGCRIHSFDTAAAALDLANTFNVAALLILDEEVANASDMQLVHALSQSWPAEPPVIVLSAQVNAHTREQARKQGLFLVAKPIAPAALRASMTQLLLARSSRSMAHRS